MEFHAALLVLRWCMLYNDYKIFITSNRKLHVANCCICYNHYYKFEKMLNMFLLLSKSPFFRGLQPEQIEELFLRIGYSIKSFSKGQLIAQREEEVRSLCIIIQGSVKGEMVDFTGKIVKIEEMHGFLTYKPH